MLGEPDLLEPDVSDALPQQLALFLTNIDQLRFGSHEARVAARFGSWQHQHLCFLVGDGGLMREFEPSHNFDSFPFLPWWLRMQHIFSLDMFLEIIKKTPMFSCCCPKSELSPHIPLLLFVSLSFCIEPVGASVLAHNYFALVHLSGT